ncbi:uncharacterized protein LAJ45_04153 [Morchella importuna]|uniref:uncharacterized protein n=1 Tax=Morchella importuna TaxID=1174673 RepID=UPI001E8EB44E|nr:uncharacterized protein LAJ45_04153 [Morchella importuna]KAH8151532.1 hypothetical protein LAJ45_04153 [Morchella importuna]
MQPLPLIILSLLSLSHATTPPPVILYGNPATTNACNLECRRAFCISVSQFLESVTCTMSRPCLSLMLQGQIQDKCFNWRPDLEVHINVPTIGEVDDCMGKDQEVEWVKPYVPVKEWVDIVVEEEVEEEERGVCMVALVLRWACFGGVVAALWHTWATVKGREIVVERRREKGELHM